MANIAFISLLWRERFNEEIGICYLVTVLRKHNHNVRVFYKWIDDSEDAYKDVLDFKPDLVGFSLSHKYGGIKPLLIGAKFLKYNTPNTHVFCGGVFASSNADNLLNICRELDTVVIGEGEPIIVDFVNNVINKYTLSNIDGITYRDVDGLIKKNPKTNMIYNLDTIDFPDRDYINRYLKDNTLKAVNIIGSRGCYGSCNFCNVPSMYSIKGKSRKWRGRSIKNIVDEIEILNSEYGVLVFNFGDASFEDSNPVSQGKERLKQFANEIINRKLKVFYSCCFRAETFKDTEEDKSLIDLMIKSGLFSVMVGIESGDDAELHCFSKRAKLNDNYETLNFFSKYPVFIAKGFIMFTPTSTYETLKRNLEFAYETKLTEDLIYLTTITEVFEDTQLVLDLQNQNLLDQNYDWQKEHPFRWTNENVHKLANEMLLIRKEFMSELEYSHFYGSSDNILEKICGIELKQEMLYKGCKKKVLREKMRINNYKFFLECIEIIRYGWDQEKYELIKNEFIYTNFINIVNEMKLEIQKFNRLLRQRDKDINELIDKYVSSTKTSIEVISSS